MLLLIYRQWHNMFILSALQREKVTVPLVYNIILADEIPGFDRVQFYRSWLYQLKWLIVHIMYNIILFVCIVITNIITGPIYGCQWAPGYGRRGNLSFHRKGSWQFTYGSHGNLRRKHPNTPTIYSVSKDRIG